MKIAISGASGYIGQKLTNYLEHSGHEILKITRQYLHGKPELLAGYLTGCYAVINLAGAPILQRWNKKNIAAIYHSRVTTTGNLTKAINSLPANVRPKVFISTSAVGIYRSEKWHSEDSQEFDSGFIGTLVKDWENASEELHHDIRKVIFRTGPVLGKESQTMKKLLPVFKLGLGGKIGNGKQPFPFIHIDDLIQAYGVSLTNEHYSGIYNLVAPGQTTNEEFTKTLGKHLKKPASLYVPSFAVKALFGKAAAILLKSPDVYPGKLIKQKFSFQYPTIEDCLLQITNK